MHSLSWVPDLVIINLHFNKIPRWLISILKFEKHSGERFMFFSWKSRKPTLSWAWWGIYHTQHNALRLRTYLLDKCITICLGTNILKVCHFHKNLELVIVNYCSNLLGFISLSTMFPLILSSHSTSKLKKYKENK